MTGRGRAALREALAAVLGKRAGLMSIAVPGDVVRLRGWPEPVEPVDVAVRGRLAGRQSVVMAVGWCEAGADTDALVRPVLAAASAARDLGAYAYLAVAAPEGLDSGGSALLALLDGGEWATLPLLVDAVGTQEALVPGRLKTAPIAEAPLRIGGEAWRLRVVAIEPDGGEVAVALPVGAA